MKRLLLILALCSPVAAQLWSGVLSATRATDWTTPGVTGGIPTSRADCATSQCSTLFGGTVTTASINAAITSASANTVVRIPAGSFTLSGGIDFGGRSSVTLRGAGADATFLSVSGSASCRGFGAGICMGNSNNPSMPSPSSTTTWTAGYAQGTTVITVGSSAGMAAGNLLILDQTDDGSDSWPALFFCSSSSVCVGEGGDAYGRANRSQQQVSQITNIAGNQVTISPGLISGNWSGTRSPGVSWANSNMFGDGVENLSIDFGPVSCGGTCGNIIMLYVRDSWIKGVRSLNSNRNHVWVYQGLHNTYRDSYFWNSKNSASTSYGVETFTGTQILGENNICSRVAGCIEVNGADVGSVYSYNFAIDDRYTVSNNFMIPSNIQHEAGETLILFEGNDGLAFEGDNIHGTHELITSFREFQAGDIWNSPAKTSNTGVIHLWRYARHYNIIGDVLGRAGYYNAYEGSNSTSIFNIIGEPDGTCSSGCPRPDDTNVSASVMRWGNYDTVNGAVRFVSGEVPTGLAQFSNTVPATQTLPASFYLSSKPAFFGSIPWPAVGPDVTGGNVSGWGNHANSIPARACYLAMGGTMVAGNDSSPLTFNASACYATGSPVSNASLAPSSLTFSSQTVGTTSAGQAVTLSNTGTATLNIASIAVTGDYAKTTTCGSTLGASSTCAITVTFTPTTTGTRSGVLTVTDDSGGVGGSTQTASVTGTGATVSGVAAPFTGSGKVTGAWTISSGSTGGGGGGGSGTTFAAVPTSWVDNTVCNPPGAYDREIVLGTTTNIGPNVTGSAIGVAYPVSILGLRDAIYNWRDNADNTSQTPHFSDKWWRIKIPAGSVLDGPKSGITYDSQQSLISMPEKMNGAAMATKCLVLESTTPLTAGVMACGRGLPGFGGARNPGCTSPNDKASMWKIQIDSSNGSNNGLNFEATTTGTWPNHMVVRDVEVAMAPGATPSLLGTNAPTLVRIDDGNSSFPPLPNPQFVGLQRFYIHANDPGDPGQPSTGGSVDAAGNCTAWDFSGTVDTVNTDGTHGTITRNAAANSSTGHTDYFGMTFTVGSTIIVNGVSRTISAFDPSASNSVITINGQPGTHTGVDWSEAHPPSQYTPGCGDSARGLVAQCDSCWIEDGYIEKIHILKSEVQAMTYGFSNGPEKIVNNWIEGGSESLFSGGAPVDTAGGPVGDMEIRRNFIGKDLNWRQLSANAGQSPSPPFGCGTIDNAQPSHNTCPFDLDIKNSLELKLGHRVLVDGNVIDGSWPDGQTGFCVLINVRTCSGGAVCGIYDSGTGLPRSRIDNIRFSNNWVRNCPQVMENSVRSEGPGNGGGVSAPMTNNDFINNLASNIADDNQFGNPGGEWQWAGAQNLYPCIMSRAANVATGNCIPFQSDFSGKITKVQRASGIVHITISVRTDPYLCVGSGATCITNGQTVIFSGVSGWNGTFAISSTDTLLTGYTDGTGGSDFIYTDAQAGDGTLCDNSGSTKCQAVGLTVTAASLGFKMTDIAIGDGVYAYDNGDGTCASGGYLTGATTSTYAVAGTVQTGLIVAYPNTGSPDSSGASHCIISNGSGFPKNTTFQNNTILAVNAHAITSFNQHFQPISNFFWGNVFADTDSGHNSDVQCGSLAEGTASLACWDLSTLKFYANVMQGRNGSTYWAASAIGGAANAFPATVNCSGATADANCLGYSGFMTGTPTVTYPIAACTSAPFNCPLMALPWANNLTLANLSYVGSSSYATQGANLTQLNTAMTQTQYVCPVGLNCGAHGPYHD